MKLSWWWLPLVLFLAGCGEDENLSEVNLYSKDYREALNWEEPDFSLVSTESYTLESVLIEDDINNMKWYFDVLLPPSYEKSLESFPVLYLLHAWDGFPENWVDLMNIKQYLDYAREYYEMSEIIVVLPQAQNTYYIDNFQEDIRYETYFHNKLMPFIESNYKVTAERAKTMISGCSMGGYGAAYYGLKYHDKFSFVLAMSTPFDGQGQNGTVPSLYSYFYECSKESFPEFIIDIGKWDSFLQSNLKTAQILKDCGLPFELIIRAGAHSYSFWKESTWLLLDRVNVYLNNLDH